MALIPETVSSNVGGVTGARAAANGDTLVPGDAVDLVVNNASGGSVNVTITGKTPCNRGVVHDLVVAVAAGTTKVIGPLPANWFADPVSGLATVNYSATASVTVYTIRS